MNRFFLMFVLLFCIIFTSGQKSVKKYYDYINKAELAICDFKYEKASQYYEKAFHAITPFCNDLFNATILNVKFTKKYDLALNYSRQLLQKDFEIGWVYNLIDPKDSLIALKFKSLEDTVKSQTNKNLKLILEEMLEEDQKWRHGEIDMCKIIEVDKNNFLKIVSLKKEFGALNEDIIGLNHNYKTLLIHFAKNLYSPRELLISSVINGDFYIKDYIQLYDLYLEMIGETPIYGRSWGQIYSVKNVLIINYPDDIERVNKERKKILLNETWDEYMKKIKYQFQFNNFQLYSKVENWMSEEEINSLIKEIDEEHQKGIYKREYVIRQNQ